MKLLPPPEVKERTVKCPRCHEMTKVEIISYDVKDMNSRGAIALPSWDTVIGEFRRVVFYCSAKCKRNFTMVQRYYFTPEEQKEFDAERKRTNPWTDEPATLYFDTIIDFIGKMRYGRF